MGINLAEIQQKIDRLLSNIAEQNRRAYELFYDPNPQDVELPQFDENGNLTTVRIPNRAKLKKQMWDDINAAVGLWYRTFYVDPDEGNDNNPGTSSEPFKTLAKAIASVPIGGYGQIILSPGKTFEIESDIDFGAKQIRIQSDRSNRAILTLKPYVTNNNQNWIAKLITQHLTWLEFDGVIFVSPDKANPNLPWYGAPRFIEALGYNFKATLFLSFNFCSFDLKNDFAVVQNAGGNVVYLGIASCDVITYGTGVFLRKGSYSAPAIFEIIGSSIDDNNRWMQ